ncbi:Cornifin (SPRR) family, putative [Leishmania donovani]|uniref:Cornifin (SPRR) family, putative n=1 Tax=Leishmania donovani TaxID=5661 RepID=A0A3Q8IE07_LEIDO|nr:Cornifin (SPRR) family, putative [Leishmania donovani]
MEAAETATPSTSRVLAEPSRPLGQKRQAPAACQRLQRRRGMDTLPAIGRLEAARRVTNRDWLHPLRALQRQRQTAAEAYIPYTIAVAEAENPQRARLALATMPLDWDCFKTKCADDLSVPWPSSAKAYRDVDAVIPAQKRLSNVDCIRRSSFVATEPPPRRLLIHEPRSRSCQGGGSYFSAAYSTTSRCGASVHTGTKDEMADTLAVKVDAVTPTRESPAHKPALPALESAADSDEHLSCISRQYARLDRLLRGYSTPDHHKIVPFRVVPNETPAALSPELAPPCLYPQPPPSTSVVSLVVQPSIQLSRRSSLSLGAPFSSSHITPEAQLTRLSVTQVQGLPSFASLTAATSGAVTTPVGGANNTLRHFRAGNRLLQHPRRRHSASSQDLSNSHSRQHRPSTTRPPYTGGHAARFRCHCACVTKGHFHNLHHHEQQQRAHVAADADRALSTLRALHNKYSQYLPVTRGQPHNCTAAAELQEASRLFPLYPSVNLKNRHTDQHHHRESSNFSYTQHRKSPESSANATTPQEAYEGVEEADRAAAPQEAYEGVEEVDRAAAPQEAYEGVGEADRAAAPQEAYEGVEEVDRAAAPQEAYEGVGEADRAAAPQEAYEGVEEADRAAAPQEAYEGVEEADRAAAPQEAYEGVGEADRAAAPQEAYEGGDRARRGLTALPLRRRRTRR